MVRGHVACSSSAVYSVGGTILRLSHWHYGLDTAAEWLSFGLERNQVSLSENEFLPSDFISAILIC